MKASSKPAAKEAVIIDKKLLTELLEIVEPFVGIARMPSLGFTLEQLVKRLDSLRSYADQCMGPLEKVEAVISPAMAKYLRGQSTLSVASSLIKEMPPVPSTKVKKSTPKTAAPKVKVWVQQWEESERGWGSRPDGFTCHWTKEDVKRFIDAHWASLPDEAPDEYSRPCGEPFEYEVEAKLAPNRGPGHGGTGVHLPHDWYPENADALPLGWRRMKP